MPKFEKGKMTLFARPIELTNRKGETYETTVCFDDLDQVVTYLKGRLETGHNKVKGTVRPYIAKNKSSVEEDRFALVFETYYQQPKQPEQTAEQAAADVKPVEPAKKS